MIRQRSAVRLTDTELPELELVVKNWKGANRQLKRAAFLHKAVAGEPGWADAKIAGAFSCRTRAIEQIRQRLVPGDFEDSVNGKQ